MLPLSGDVWRNQEHGKSFLCFSKSSNSVINNPPVILGLFYGMRGLCLLGLGFWFRGDFFFSPSFFFFSCNWEIASRFLTLWRIPVASCCERSNVLNSKELLRPSPLLEFTQDFPLPFREWTMYRKYFFSLFKKKTLSGVWAFLAAS